MPGSSPAPWGSSSGTAGPALSACRTWRQNRCPAAAGRAPPLCAAEGIGVIPWSPQTRGKLTRDWNYTSIRTETDEAFGRLFAKTEDADRICRFKHISTFGKSRTEQPQDFILWDKAHEIWEGLQWGRVPTPCSAGILVSSRN